MLFFGTMAAMLTVIALIMVIPVLAEYVLTGLVPRLPTFIGACFFMLFAMLLFSCGLILDTQGKLARQNFELQMNLLKNRGE